MRETFQINLFDIKLAILIIACIYIYVRKKLKIFLNIAAALIIFMSCIKFTHISSGVRTVVFASLLCLVFIASYKEVFAIDRSGITAHQALKPDKYDLIVFILLLSVWFVARSII